MNSAITCLLSMEMNAMLEGGILRNIHETEQGSFWFTIYAGSEKSVFARLKGECPAICVTSAKRGSAAVPSSFCMLMRKYIKNRRISSVSSIAGKKAIIFNLEDRDRSYRLIFDFSKREGNLSLLMGNRTLGSFMTLSYDRISPEGEYIYPEPSDITSLLPEGDTAPCISGGRMLLSEVEGGRLFDSVNDMVFEWGCKEHEESKFERKSREMLSMFDKELKKLEKRKEAIKGDLEKLEQNESLAETGRAILANIYQIRPGTAHISIESPDNPGRILEIELNPSISPSENAESYFAKYAKSKRGLPILKERIKETDDKIAYIKEAREEALKADNLDKLIEIESDVRTGTPVTKNSSLQISSPRKYNYMGFTILSGKNSAQNEEVSLRLAAKNDIWLHAGGMGGSHVIIKTKSGEKTPKEVILRAAEIAAYHSKGKNSSKVPVSYTLAKNVSKKKGMPQGMVAVSKTSSIMASPSGYDFLEWLRVNEKK